jgi:hypothetical protein
LIKFLTLVPVALAIALASVGLAHAQGSQPRPTPPPYPAIFGGSIRPSDRHALDLSASLAEAYETNGLVDPDESGLFGPTEFQESGAYTNFASDLTYSYRGGVEVQTRASTELRYYPQLGRIVSVSHQGGLDLSVRRGGTQVRVGQGVTYLPSNLAGLFAQPVEQEVGAIEILPPASDYALYTDRYTNYLTSATVDQKISRRGSLSFDANYAYVDYVNPNPLFGLEDMPSYHAGGHYSYQLARNKAINFGYGYGNASYSAGLRPISQHSVDVGMTYQRRLSGTRMTTFQFSVGSTTFGGSSLELVPLSDATGAIASVDPTASTAPGLVPPTSDTGRQYGVTGSVQVATQIGRSWTANGSYQRGLSYVDGLRDATFGDSITLAANGFVDRRIDLTASVSYSKGNFPLAEENAPSGYSTYSTNIRARLALTGSWAAYLDYLYYFYDFESRVPLPLGVPPGMTRNSIRAGLTLWVPIMRHR